MNSVLSILLRTVFFYFFVLLMYRIMGKREVGELGITDLIVSLLIAEIIAISIEDYNGSILKSVAPILALVILEIGLDYISLKSKRLKNIFEGKPSVIINKGKINFNEMVKQRFTIDDLLKELRLKEIKSLEEVDYALLETNGQLSVFKKKMFDGDYPMPIILDGTIQEKTLKYINKSKLWIKDILDKNDIKLEEIFYAFYQNKSFYIIKKNNEKNRKILE